MLALAAAVFAGGAEEGAQAADQAAPEAMAGAGMTFDHEWDSLRTFVTVSEYTRQTGNAVGDYHEAPELAARVADGSLQPVADRLPADPALVVPYHEIGQYGGTAFIRPHEPAELVGCADDRHQLRAGHPTRLRPPHRAVQRVRGVADQR